MWGFSLGGEYTWGRLNGSVLTNFFSGKGRVDTYSTLAHQLPLGSTTSAASAFLISCIHIRAYGVYIYILYSSGYMQADQIDDSAPDTYLVDNSRKLTAVPVQANFE